MKSFFTLTILLLLGVTAACASTAVVSSQSDVSATTTSTLHLAKNVRRAYLLVVNKGSESVLLKFASAHSAIEGVLIPAGGNYEPYVVPIDAVYLKSSSGTQTVAIVEGSAARVSDIID